MKTLRFLVPAIILLVPYLIPATLNAQTNSLVNTAQSPHALLRGVNLGDVTWTDGFWADRFNNCRNVMVPTLWDIYHDASVSHAFKNFEIAAGLDTGRHSGPPFHDGDFYKLLEAMASVYAITQDQSLDSLMDAIITVIARAQRADGYLHTPVLIAQRQQPERTQAFEDRLNFETYNLGHLMTAGCIHYRATGKKTLLNVAIKATDFLVHYFETASPALARNAICPSHYMGVVEMYRTTGNPAYLTLAQNLIDIRRVVEDGTDHNQDRIPFRQQREAIGHAVRANYLYAGAADVYLETGDDSLRIALEAIWQDMVSHKLYVTGACGALYDGVSPNGTSYSPPQIQQVHQAYGQAYQLPNLTAHNESCANVGNVLWNWRMLQITGEARFADVMELALYNSVLSAISLSGDAFFYTNPLAVKADMPFDLRWSGGRQRYISLSNCCPPNVVRTLAEVNQYAYNTSSAGLWFNLYGSNTLHTTLPNGQAVALTQETRYPWDGTIRITLQKAIKKECTFFLRIPGWCQEAHVTINGKAETAITTFGHYYKIHRKWAKGDVIELVLNMPVTLLEANPLVEATQNQVAVKRGPLIYCLESMDVPYGETVDDIRLGTDVNLIPVNTTLAGSALMVLEGVGTWRPHKDWDQTLYRPLTENSTSRTLPVRLVPYYSWGNRGTGDMTVWVGFNPSP